MKKLVALTLALMMALSLVSLVSSEEKPKVGFITQSLTNASQAYAWTQFQKYADEYGFEVSVFEEDYDPQKGVAAIGTAIAQGYKAICINPTDPSAIIPSLMDARGAGVIVGMYSSELPEEYKANRDFMVGTDDYMCGEVAAQELMKAFPDGCNVLEVGGQSGHSAQIKRHDGFAEKIAGTNINLLDSRDCKSWDTAEALAITEDFIVKYGDQIDAIYCHWDNGATGVIQALKASNLTKPVYVIGVDGNKQGYEQVRAGEQALCIGQSFSQMTQDAFTLITKMIKGEEHEDVVWTALDVVTPETIDNFPWPEW